MKSAWINNKPLVIALLCIITFICFRYSIHNQFTNWDDDYYVTNDQYIRAFTPHNLKVLFTEDITKNNYHPFCMLSLAVNYFFTQMDPWSYYLTNILIHMANVALIFLLFRRLCAMLKVSEEGTAFISILGALWFGIHPMHVESVSWIAERKDVLYAFFYIWGLITYINYLETQKKKWFWITFVLFVCSCLSKPMAVMFPVSLLCIDVLAQRKLQFKLLLEKTVFFLGSLVCGGFAFYTQSRVGAIASFGKLTIGERVMYASYGYIKYIGKLFSPTRLSSFYPYPYRMISGNLQPIYYEAPFIALAVIAIPLWWAYKKNKEYFKILLFGLGFFTANLIFVLQFISCGAAIMADRYSYVSYIGLLFIIGYFLYELIRRSPMLRTPVIAVLVLCSCIFGYLCYDRTLVWHDSETLHSDAIEKYPYQAWLSYKWLGNYYFDKQDYDKALENYKVLAMLRMADDRVQRKIDAINAIKSGGGDMFTPGIGSGQTPGAAQPQVGAGGAQPSPANVPPDVKAMFANQPSPANGMGFQKYIDSTIFYCNRGDTLKGFRSYINALRLNRSSEQILADSSFRMLHRNAVAGSANIYSVLLKINTSNPFYYFYRGVGRFGQQNVNAAITDWQIAVKMNSKDVIQSAAYNLGVAYDGMGKDSLAVYYVEMAKNAGYNVSPEYLAKLKEKLKGGKK